VIRAQAGCQDTQLNGTDFTVVTPNPRNSATAADVCTCTAMNESGASGEVDYCDTQSPLSISAAAASTSPIVYGRIYEMGVTEAAGANATVLAELGWGPVTANPEWEPGYFWTAATYNVQVGNNDEYQATFTLPPAGTYNYVYRFSFDNGASWTVCDNNQGDSGAGSNPNLTFDLENRAVLTSN
jgi:hypothetical protein